MGTEKQPRENEDILKQSVGYARHIKNFMRAIQVVKDGCLKSAVFSENTKIFRSGDFTCIEINISEDAPKEIISIPDEITDEDLFDANRVGEDSKNFMTAIGCVKDKVLDRAVVNDKTAVYRKGDIVRIDILSPRI